MATVTTTATPYCTVARLFDLADWRVVADWCSDGRQRPTRRAVLDPNDSAGKVAANAVMAASGDVETFAMAGGKYTPAILNSLTGATKARLESLTAACAVWLLAARRNPAATDMRGVPGVQAAKEALEQLRKGELIFGIVESQEAAAMHAVPMYDRDNGAGRTVTNASRFFGYRGND